MSDFLTVADVLAMHEDQIQRYGGTPGIRIRAAGKPLCFDRRQAITRI